MSLLLISTEIQGRKTFNLQTIARKKEKKGTLTISFYKADITLIQITE